MQRILLCTHYCQGRLAGPRAPPVLLQGVISHFTAPAMTRNRTLFPRRVESRMGAEQSKQGKLEDFGFMCGDFDCSGLNVATKPGEDKRNRGRPEGMRTARVPAHKNFESGLSSACSHASCATRADREREREREREERKTESQRERERDRQRERQTDRERVRDA